MLAKLSLMLAKASYKNGLKAFIILKYGLIFLK